MFRWAILAVLVLTLGISGLHRRRARMEAGAIPRRREGGWLVLGRLVVALPLFGSVVAYVLDPERMSWAALDLPEWSAWAGLALGLLVPVAAWWVLRSLGSNVSETVLTKSGQTLVTDGPYRWVRHPLYLTGVALFVAVGLMAANGLMLALALVALAGVSLVVIPREEAQLLARFGDDYRDYMERTGRLWPRLWRKGSARATVILFVVVLLVALVRLLG